MPRARRKLGESKIYHVMIRGNERKALFLDDEDRIRFLEILHDKNQDNKYQLYAYCIMSNHVHLLLNEGSDQISRIMKSINVSYAYYFNKKYDRVGHLFQDRFRSEVIDKESYLLSAARYIHRNPVKAGIVDKASQYEWSSYNAYIGKNAFLAGIVHKDMILDLFSHDRKRAVALFMDYTDKDNDDVFIEYKEEQPEQGKTITTEEAAKAFTDGYLRSKGLTLADLKNKSYIPHRSELIRQLKTRSNLSVRQLENILGLNRNIIQRVK